ncbi:MAG: Fic family protein [Chitinophagales bacterium]
MKGFIYAHENWPNFYWQTEQLVTLLADVRNMQGKLTGKMTHVGFDLRNRAYLETLSQDIVKSSEIEGESLPLKQVRSSIAVRLGINLEEQNLNTRNVDGVVEMMLDATQNCDGELNKERLFAWQAALFPTGKSGMYEVITGNWRDDSTGPMQVVSGALGKQKVHFQAPQAEIVAQEMQFFLEWFNTKQGQDPILKAAIAHLWFLTIHPFEDGNGRIARAITDMILTKAEDKSQRFYSMSAQIEQERKAYYLILERTQKGNLDITKWLIWFLECLKNAVLFAETIVEKVLFKHKFWVFHSEKSLNKRQIKIINLLLDNFKGKLKTSKWAKINRCSQDTALRDIQDLIKKNILKKETAGGRSTNYELVQEW